MRKNKSSYAIFSLGERHGTSSSSSSSLSSPSSATSCDIFKVELVNMSGTGKILGRLELRRWLIISGLSRLGFSPALGMSKWFPVTVTSTVAADPGVGSFKHWRESDRPELSGKIAATENYPCYKTVHLSQFVSIQSARHLKQLFDFHVTCLVNEQQGSQFDGAARLRAFPAKIITLNTHSSP